MSPDSPDPNPPAGQGLQDSTSVADSHSADAELRTKLEKSTGNITSGNLLVHGRTALSCGNPDGQCEERSTEESTQ